jgi:hypothetical protein
MEENFFKTAEQNKKDMIKGILKKGKAVDVNYEETDNQISSMNQID